MKNMKNSTYNIINTLIFILIVSLIAINIQYKPSSKELTEREKCLQENDYLTCDAIKTCGGLDKVAKITHGGFFEINKGFECK